MKIPRLDATDWTGKARGNGTMVRRAVGTTTCHRAMRHAGVLTAWDWRPLDGHLARRVVALLLGM